MMISSDKQSAAFLRQTVVLLESFQIKFSIIFTSRELFENQPRPHIPRALPRATPFFLRPLLPSAGYAGYVPRVGWKGRKGKALGSRLLKNDESHSTRKNFLVPLHKRINLILY